MAGPKRVKEIQSQLSRKLRAISNCNQTLLRAEDEQALLDEICHIICDHAGYRMAWVGYPQNDADKTIRPMAWAGVEDNYLAQAQISWADAERGHGPGGSAIRSGMSVCIQDFTTDPKAALWRETALQRGYRSSIALPLKDTSANTFGILNIYSAVPNIFTQEEIQLLEELAEDIAFGITILRTRIERRRNEMIMHARLRLLEYAEAHTMDELLTATLDEIEALTGSSIGFYHFVETDQRILTLQSWSTNTTNILCTAEGRGSHYGVDQAEVWADSVRERRPLIHNDYASLPNSKGMPEGQATVTREVVVPIFRGGQIVAIIGIGNKPEDYDEGDIETVSQLGDLSWDIAARKQAESAIRLSEEKYRTLIQKIQTGVVVHGANTEILTSNSAAQKILGLTEDQMQGKTAIDPVWHFYREDRTTVPIDEYPVNQVFSSRQPLRNLVLGVHHPNRENNAWVLVNADPVFGKEGELTQVIVTFIDITERKQAEEALEAQEIKFRTVADYTYDWEYWLGPNQELFYISPACARITGYSRAEFEADPGLLSSIVYPADRDIMNAHQSDYLNLDDSLLEFRIVHRDGSIRWITHGCQAVYGSDGQFMGRRISNRDDTERKATEQLLVASEQLFRTLIENSPDLIARYDLELRRVYVNPAILKLFEAPVEQVLGGTPAMASPLHDPGRYMARIQQAIDTATECSDEGSFRNFDGETRWASMRFAPEFGPDGKVATVIVISHDITERKQYEESLRLAASVFANSHDGIMISDADNRIIDVNPAFTRLTGYERNEAIGKNPGFLSAGRQNREFYAEMWRSINTKGEWQGELWNRHKSGEEYAELISIVAVKDEHGRLQHYVGAFTDITVLKEHEADLNRIAHYDGLTEVPNRRLLSDRMQQAIARARRHGNGLAVCYLDLDGFKPINDQFGHDAGDSLLVEISQRLQSLSRGDDTVARLGGDEFVLLWNDIKNESECHQTLERILAEISAPMLLEGEQVSVSASIGVTLYPDDDVDADNLLRHADHAMYSAKQLGKNRYQMFDARMERKISSRVEFLDKIEHGLDSGQFELYYQPKLDCINKTVSGVEALLRWNDPILGLVGPKEFLPLIENNNLAFRIGRWVLEQVVRQAKLWNDMDITIPISINTFPSHLKHHTFIDDLRNAITQHWPEMPKRRLLMEIIETSYLEELDPIEQVIKECQYMGIGFSLDDFGTGYSSLVYLRRLSVEELKIDQSFVRDMLEDTNDEAIVVGVIGLGQAFGLRVVAEGVESSRQANYLTELGCSVVQGYGLGRPMPAEDFQLWYADFLVEGAKLCR